MNIYQKYLNYFSEYKKELNQDLSFQPADTSEEEIKKRYKEPEGRIFIAIVNEKPAGCIAYHPMENEKNCELKRLYVKPEYRGLKIGKILIKKAIEEAKNYGYEKIYLDTLSTLESACRLYEKFGFEQIEAYYYNPLKNVRYYLLKLR